MFEDANLEFSQRSALYRLLVKADELEVTVPAEVADVYNNATATLDELNAAIEAISDILLKVELEQSGEVDVTAQYIVNPNIDGGNTAGWSGLTGESWWNTDDWHIRPESHSNEDGTSSMSGYICRFVWSGGWIGNLNNDVISQTFTLPAGRYRLEADCVGFQEGDGADAYGSPQDWTGKVKGFYLFAQTKLGETRTAVETAGKVPQRFKVEFLSAGGDATIGLKIDDAFGSYFGGDNFRLYCTSLIDSPNAVEMMTLMNNLTACLDNYENAPFSKAAYDLIEKYNESGEAALEENSEDTYLALIAEGKKLDERVKEEIAAYGKLGICVVDANEAISQSRYIDLGDDANTTLAQCFDNMAGHLYEADITAAQALALIDEWKATLARLIAENVNEIGEGYDVTCLLDNGEFKKGSEWYNGNGSQLCEGWNGERPWAYMPGNDGAKGTVEFINQDFDFYQELHNMPAGVYTIQFRGLYRWGTKEEAVAAMGTAKEIERNVARFYLNDVEVPFKTITEDAFVLNDDEEIGGGNYSTGKTDAEGNTLCIPDASWYYFWRHTDCHQNAAAVVVGEDGVLRIGFKAKSDIHDHWALISAPTLRYEGNTPAAYAAAYALLGNALTEKRDRAYASNPMSKELYDMPETMTAKAEAVAENGTDTQRAAMLTTLTDARQGINRQLIAVSALADSYNYYIWMLLADKSSAEFEQALNGMQETLKGACLPWETNAEMAAADHDLNALFTAGVQAKGTDASLAAPYNMSIVVRNTDFIDEVENVDSDKYWNGTVGKAAYGVYSIDAAAFDLNQTIAGLPKGFYRLTVQGFEQNAQDQSTTSLYAAVGSNEYSSPLMVLAYDNESPWNAESAADEFNNGMFADNSIDFAVTAESADVKIGVKKPAETEGNWTAITHFQLFYLGQDAPVAVTAVAAANAANILYNLGGQRITTPQRGIYIRDGKKYVK